MWKNSTAYKPRHIKLKSKIFFLDVYIHALLAHLKSQKKQMDFVLENSVLLQSKTVISAVSLGGEGMLCPRDRPPQWLWLILVSLTGLHSYRGLQINRGKQQGSAIKVNAAFFILCYDNRQS